MFTVTYVSSEDSKLSKAEILRGIISEKLTAAAQEIFAVVERTVAGYEEEASGLRHEVDRQRRQLEVVLQPRVSLCRIDEHGLLPVCEVEKEEAAGVTAETYCFEYAEKEEGDDEQDPSQSAGSHQDLLQEQKNQTPPRITEETEIGNCRTPDSHNKESESKTDSLSSNTTRKRSVRRSFRTSPANSAPDSTGEANDNREDNGEDDSRPTQGNAAQKKNQTKLLIKKRHLLKLRVCFINKCQTTVLSNEVFRTCPLQELKCPRGLGEADFLNLLRSVFPHLPAGKPFDLLKSDKTRRLRPLKVKTLTPEEVYRNLRRTGAGKSVLYLRLKTGDELQASRQLDLLQGKDDATTDSPSTSTSLLTSDKPRRHMRSIVQCKEENRVDVLSSPSTSQQDVTETDEGDNNEEAGISKPSDDVQTFCSENSVAESKADTGDEEKMNDRDDDFWKPGMTEGKVHKRKVKSSKMRRKQGRKQGRKWTRSSLQVFTDNSDAVVSCKVCGVLYKSKNIVIRHAWSHVDDPKRLCGVCGEHSESAEELRSHLQSHLKTHICNICGKTFIRLNDFMEHTAGHTGQTPHKCDVCGKGFFFKLKLSIHQKTHLMSKHKCYLCKKSFSSQAELKRHNSLHTKNVYCCSLCGKSLRNLRNLSQHMLIHSGEKPYRCDVCGKHFRLLNTQKKHKNLHTVSERPYFCDVCCKCFYSKFDVNAHLKTHKKLHTCSTCGKELSSNIGLRAHMKVHS